MLVAWVTHKAVLGIRAHNKGTEDKEVSTLQVTFMLQAMRVMDRIPTAEGLKAEDLEINLLILTTKADQQLTTSH